MKTAEDVSNLIDEGDKTDAIASLLIGDEEGEANVDENEDDSTTDESLSDESTDSDQSDGADESEDEGEAEAESDDAEQESADDDSVTWENVLGVSEDKLSFDDDGNLSGVKVKVNGETSVVPMNDLLAGYQQNKSITIKGQNLSKERKEFDEQREKVAQAYQARLKDVDALNKHLESRLVSDFEGIDWNKLRAEQPAEYAAMRQDFSERIQQIEQTKLAIASAEEKAANEAAEASKGEALQFIKVNYEKMVDNNPTWSDDKVFEKDMNQLCSFIVDEYGFDQKDFVFARDARLVELIQDARKYKEGVKLAKDKLNKKTVPKFQKSAGKKKMTKTSKLDKLTKAAKNASGGRKRQLQSEAVAELLLGG